jgi:hypothetical protein
MVMKKKMMFLFLISFGKCASCSKNLHDGKSEAGLEHGASAVDVQSERAARDLNNAEVRAVCSAPDPVGAVGISDSSKFVDSTDESTNEEKVNKGDEIGRVAGFGVEEQGTDCPCCCQSRYYEEDEDRSRCEEVAVVEEVDKPGEHANDRNQGDDLEDPPEHEGEARKRHDGWRKLLRWML